MKTFNEKCYQLLKQVPKGKVTTYKALANKLNSKAYRAVGNAMNKNPTPFSLISPREGGRVKRPMEGNKTPCHRVINSNGNLGGFAFGVKNKIKLLKSEGIEIKNNKIDLKKYEYRF